MVELTPKQDDFALAYVETGNASKAYRRAYATANMKPETIWSNASRLLDDSKVAARIRDLQNDARQRHEVTIDNLTTELEDARLKAMGDPKGASAAVAAIMGKAKLHGLLVDKNELSSPDETVPIRKLSDFYADTESNVDKLPKSSDHDGKICTNDEFRKI